MSSTFPVGALVWLKQPDYPWWPGVVIEATSAGLELPGDGRDICVMCFPSSASTVAFASAQDAGELRPFLGEGSNVTDAEEVGRVKAARADADCAAALDEALRTLSEVKAATSVKEKEGATAGEAARVEGSPRRYPSVSSSSSSSSASREEGEGERGAHIGRGVKKEEEEQQEEADEAFLLGLVQDKPAETAPRADGPVAVKHEDGASGEKKKHRHEHKHRSKEEKERRKKEKKAKKEKEKRKRPRSSSRSVKSENDNDDDDEEEVGGRAKRPSGNAAAASHGKKKSASEKDRSRQSRLDEYEREAERPPTYSAQDDAEYYYRKCREARKVPDNATLIRCAEDLQKIIADCLSSGAYEAAEEALMDLLRPLARYDVTFVQLRDTKIGAVVGQLLLKAFPDRVSQLANAILMYWFQSLPQNMQSEFYMDSEVDRCSIDTTAGERSDDVDRALGAVGVHIFESFTDEEIYDTPPDVNVIEVCKEIENALKDNNDDVDTRVMVLTSLGDPANSDLRRALLDRHVLPRDLLQHASDLPALMRTTTRRGLRLAATGYAGGSNELNTPLSPFSPLSPMGVDGGGGSGNTSFMSPTGTASPLTSASLYTCPNCGSQEAYRTMYSVQSHDNYPDILRCKRCNTTWNSAER